MEQKIDKGFNWIEKALQIVEKYKFKTIFKAVAVILIVAATVGFLKNPTWIFEQYEEWKEKQHQEQMDLRNVNNQKIHIHRCIFLLETQRGLFHDVSTISLFRKELLYDFRLFLAV